MSIEAITYVKLLALGDAESPSARLLLYVIAENTFNDTGLCKVGQAELAGQTRVSERTVRRQLDALEEADAPIVKREARYPKHGGRETDAIEIVGFKEWLTRQRATAGPSQSGQPDNVSGSPGNAEGGYRTRVSDDTGHQVSGSYRTRTQSPYNKDSEQDARTRATVKACGLSGTDVPSGMLAAGQQAIAQAASARAADEIASGERLPFSTAVIRELTGLDIDVMELVERYLVRTEGKRIEDPSAYLLAMGRDEVAKRLGIPVGQVKAMASRDVGEREAAVAQGAGFAPSADAVARARRSRPELVDLALELLAGRTFPTQIAADKALDAARCNARFAMRPGAAIAAQAAVGGGI